MNGYDPGPVDACDRCDSPAPDLDLELGDVDGEQVCHVCRRQELEEATTLSEREALTVALKDSGWTHEEIAEWGDLQKSTVDEYSRRANQKLETAKQTVETLEPIMSDNSERLTENGILTDYETPENIRVDYRDHHGEPVHEGEDRVVFADEHGHELNDWADALGMDRGELSERMHELAREVYGRDEAEGTGDPWSVVDPVVFDAETFADE